MKKVIFIISIFFLLGIIECCVKRPPCSDPETIYYRFNKIKELNNIAYWHLNNKYYFDWLNSDSTYYNYGFSIKFDYEYVSQKMITNSSFFNSALARKVCDDDKYINSNKISGIKIFSINDFDTLHYAHSEITEYFKAFTQEFMGGEIEELKELSEFIDIGITNWNNNINFILMKKPTLSNNVQFEFKIIFDDNIEIIDTTKAIKFY